MKLTKLFTGALAALFFTPLAAHALDLSLQFSFEDQYGLVTGNGDFSVVPILADPSAYLATAGSLNITAPSADGISGTYQLFGNVAAPSATTSPTGLFIYDNLIIPGASPVVTNPGLLGYGGLAVGGVPEGRGHEINFFSNGVNTYDLYTGASGSYSYAHEFTTSSAPGGGKVKASFGAGSTLIAAPEPPKWLIMGSFLLIVLARAKFKTPLRD